MSRIVLAIDPGTTHSGWCTFSHRHVIGCGSELANADVLEMIKAITADVLALEMIASYGMPVGRETFETVLWTGRFVQAWRDPNAAKLVYRQDVKLHLCGSARAKDPNVRQALLDMLGPVGVKASPGPLYGVSGHAWSALAVAATVEQCRPLRNEMAGIAEASA